MAEARSAVSEPRVGRIEEGRNPKEDFLLGLRAYVIRRFFRIRNSIKNGMWPTKLWNLEVLIGLLSILLVTDWSIAQPITAKLRWMEECLHIPKEWPLLVRSLLTSCVAGFVFFIILLYIRRYSLRILLSYRGWMYEQPKTQALSTVVWGLLVKLVSGSHPSLYGCQQSLPKQPVPPLKQTLKGLIESLKPLYGENSEIIQDLKKESKEFQKTLGPKLQRILYLKSWWAQNYVTDFWEKYVYLMGRSPLPINSNYYIMDQSFGQPTTNQVARAANVMYQFMLVKQKIDREQVEPLLIRNTIPICMSQYERVFSTTRVPGEEMDTLVHYESSESKFAIVNRKGIFYKLDMYDSNRKLVSAVSLQKQLHWIMQDAEKHIESYSESERSLAALTGTERKEWAILRKQYFMDGVNADSLALMEKALFHVWLSDDVNKDFSSRARHLFVGDGKSIWFDKSLTLIISRDGRFGLNGEHSYADAPVIGHILEYNYTYEVIRPHIYFDEYGNCRSTPDDNVESDLNQPSRLQWNIPSSLGSAVKRAVSIVSQAMDDIDHRVEGFFNYGKGFIKTCKVSPDAFIQMALQITYYKNAGKPCLTYESSMTRLYLMGRTETVRSLTLESAAFVKAFLDKTIDKSEKIRLLRKACEVHAKMYKDAMNGKGIDRHLFALYVVSKGLDYDCHFLKKCLSIPWTLSTSQQPQQQLASSPSCDIPEYRDMVSPGGGFGPVSDDGYGVSYMIPGDFKFFFHVSSKKSSKCTDSTLFMTQLFETLDEMKDLFENNAS
ncbi:carnitine O-palmitoyltransferase 1, liver isoform-like isoform X2 [Mercenaria mercenaria]|uniref:carnitine O-palmitoyltransferase 1, liver isoform-like isoform X2 n=1 Tax=Mercenaria mercenaria TaxID=6596 RepID=UPI00234FAF60|nr:carnitine O-palmitoyltransferase 1, liver isoform-like isoform X2 [Mercenaria mercenaria]